MEILPAILPESFEELSIKLGDVARIARTVHVDICDGMFVPRVSWPYGDTDEGHFISLQKEEEGLPFWDKLDFEAHLMVSHPEKMIAQWISVGMSRIIVQAEAVKDPSEIRSEIGDMTELGVSLKLETPLDSFLPFADFARTLHLMSIARIGYQGEEFQESVLEKVEEAHKRFPDVAISVDGGVSLENARDLIDAGASRLVVGSALYDSADIADTYKQFLEILV